MLGAALLALEGGGPRAAGSAGHPPAWTRERSRCVEAP